MANIRVLRANESPLVEVGLFRDSPGFAETWNERLRFGRLVPRKLLTDYYWQFNQGNGAGLRAAEAVSLIVIGLGVRHRTYGDINASVMSGTSTKDQTVRDVAFLALTTALEGDLLGNPAELATYIVATANDNLQAANSPYHLPLPQ